MDVEIWLPYIKKPSGITVRLSLPDSWENHSSNATLYSLTRLFTQFFLLLDTMSSVAPPANAITERVIIPVKGGVDDWKEPYKQFLLTLKEQPGFIRTRWGPRSENMGVIDLLVGTGHLHHRFILCTTLCRNHLSMC